MNLVLHTSRLVWLLLKMRASPVFDSFFCIVVFWTAVVKTLPQEIAELDTDFQFPQGREEVSFVASQAKIDPPLLPLVPSWTEKTPDTEGSSTNEQGFPTDRDLITASNVDQSLPINSLNQVINGQAAPPVYCNSLFPSGDAKLKNAASCIVEPDQPSLPKIPNKPLHDPERRVLIRECPENKYAFCCDAAQYDPDTESYGDCSNCLFPPTHVFMN